MVEFVLHGFLLERLDLEILRFQLLGKDFEVAVGQRIADAPRSEQLAHLGTD